MDYLARAASFIYKDTYFEQFENNGGNIQNSTIPDGQYLVYVDYNISTKEIDVTRILFKGEDIIVTKDLLKMYEGIHQFFNTIYLDKSKVGTSKESRQHFTKANRESLFSMRDSYTRFLRNVDSRVNKYLESLTMETISKIAKDTSQQVWNAFFKTDKTISQEYNIIKTSIESCNLAAKENRLYLQGIVTGLMYEKIDVLIKRVEDLLTTRTNNIYNINTLSLALYNVIIDINSIKSDAISTEDYKKFKIANGI